MRTRSSKSPWSSARVARGLALLALACNAITGVNDLEFSEPEALSEPDVVGGPEVTENPLEACNAFTGAGCEAGQTCRLSREQGGPACLPLASSTLAPYSACELDGQCPAGHACSDGVCVQLCATESDCGWPDARCLLGDENSFGFGRCSRNCDLASAAVPRTGRQACGLGTRCDFTAEPGGDGHTDCVVAGSAAIAGGACAVDADCPANFSCRNGGCELRCDLGVNVCDGTASCADIQDRAGQRVGTCCEIPEGDACDVVSDCGCSAEQTCSWGLNGIAACRELAAAPREPYAPCDDHFQCPAHYICASGVCSQQCYTSDDCGIISSACQAVTFDDVTAPVRSVCSPPCNPVDPAGADPGFVTCDPGTSCSLFSDGAGGADAFRCSPYGAALEGSACSTHLDCSLGLGCFSGSVCARWCSPDADTCGAGFSCGNVQSQGGQLLGACCALPEGQACDLLTNCGCDSDQSCSVQNGVRSCRAVDPAPVATNQACVADAECPQLHSCVFGACKPHCASATDCAGEGAACMEIVSGSGNTVCTYVCDPFSPQAPSDGVEACGTNLMCTDVFNGETLQFTCTAPGTVPEGGDCSLQFCEPGLTCTGNLTCSRYCELGTSCGDTECTSYDPPLPLVGGLALGFCPIVTDEDDDD